MKPLYTTEEYQLSKYSDKLPLQCYCCGKTFYIEKHYLNSTDARAGKKFKFCGQACVYTFYKKSTIQPCGNCGKNVIVQTREKRNSKSGKNFCSRSCAATYNNTHKTTGTRRSKLEAWLEKQLTNEFVGLDIVFNDVKTVNAELDIYIPSLNLAFELNGIFHYEPIYGPEKLAKIKNNDERRFQACLAQNIELVIIDVSGQKYFKEATSKKYWDIIQNIINKKLLR